MTANAPTVVPPRRAAPRGSPVPLSQRFVTHDLRDASTAQTIWRP